jgi:hypothetical protein
MQKSLKKIQPESGFVLAGQPVEEIVTLVETINKEESYWKTEIRQMINPQPNMGPRRAMTTSPRQMDEFGSSNLDNYYVQLLIDAVKKYPQLCFYIEMDLVGYCLSVVYCTSPLLQGWNGDKEHKTLIKFEPGSVTDKVAQSCILEMVFSKENRKKHHQFGLEKIEEDIAFYEY